MSVEKGVRKIDALILGRRHRPGELSTTVIIRLDVRAGEFRAEHAGQEFRNMSLPALRDEIREHDGNVGDLKWEPMICVRKEGDSGSWGEVEVLGVSYWRMFRACAKGCDVWRAWKGDTEGKFSEPCKKGLDVMAVGVPSTWESCGSGVKILPYTVQTWKGLRTLSRMEAELKAKLERIVEGKKADLVKFLQRTPTLGLALLGDGAGKDTTC